MSELTFDKIMETYHDILRKFPREPSILDSLKPGRFMGMPIFEAPPPQPKVQVRDLKFEDGTSILPDNFRREMNAWLVDRFGYRDDPFKDHAYICSGNIIMSSRHIAMLHNVTC
jgi:hypothetical protein